MKDCLNTACLAAQCLEREGAPVVVAEQEGRDLALLVTSLTLVILQPDTRTLHGFEALVEREWVQVHTVHCTLHTAHCTLHTAVTNNLNNTNLDIA